MDAQDWEAKEEVLLADAIRPLKVILIICEANVVFAGPVIEEAFSAAVLAVPIWPPYVCAGVAEALNVADDCVKKASRQRSCSLARVDEDFCDDLGALDKDAVHRHACHRNIVVAVLAQHRDGDLLAEEILSGEAAELEIPSIDAEAESESPRVNGTGLKCFIEDWALVSHIPV